MKHVEQLTLLLELLLADPALLGRRRPSGCPLTSEFEQEFEFVSDRYLADWRRPRRRRDLSGEEADADQRLDANERPADEADADECEWEGDDDEGEEEEEGEGLGLQAPPPLTPPSGSREEQGSVEGDTGSGERVHLREALLDELGRDDDDDDDELANCPAALVRWSQFLHG